MSDEFYYNGHYLGKSDGTSRSVIRIDLNQLNFIISKQLNPTQHIKDDIKVYNYILDHVDSEYLAEQYLKTKQENTHLTKMEIAKSLGWNIK